MESNYDQNTLHTCMKFQSISKTHFLKIMMSQGRNTPEAQLTWEIQGQPEEQNENKKAACIKRRILCVIVLNC